jgi:hypothetical protein
MEAIVKEILSLWFSSFFKNLTKIHHFPPTKLIYEKKALIIAMHKTINAH